MSEFELRKVIRDGVQIRMAELVEGDRFQLLEPDGGDLGMWLVTGAPRFDPEDGRTIIEARPDIENGVGL
jgi:hypothetical protein